MCVTFFCSSWFVPVRQAWFYTRDTHQLQSFLSLCLAVDLNGPAPQPGYQDYRTDTGPQAGETPQVLSDVVISCAKDGRQRRDSYWNSLSEMTRRLWISKLRLELNCHYHESPQVKDHPTNDIFCRSSRAGWQAAVQGRCICRSVAFQITSHALRTGSPNIGLLSLAIPYNSLILHRSSFQGGRW